MSKIRLGTTNINFKSKTDLNRIFTSVVSVPIGPAGALMSRISPTIAYGLADYSISNIVMSGNIAYFTSVNPASTIYTAITRVDLSTNTPTLLSILYGSGGGVYYGGDRLKKASAITTSNASVVNTTGTGTINSSTLTVASSTGILLYSIVSGTGIRTSSQVLGINGNVLTLSQTLSSTIAASAVTFTDLPIGVNSVISYNDTNAGQPGYSYQIFNPSTLTTTSIGIPTLSPFNFGYTTYAVVRNTDGSFWGIGDDNYDNGNGGIFPILTQAGYKGGTGTGWSKYASNGFQTIVFNALSRDSTNNAIILLNQAENTNGTYRSTLQKISYGSNVNQLWTTDFTISGVLLNFAKGDLLTFNDFHYIAGKNQATGAHILIKVNNSGAIVWAKSLSGMANIVGDISIHVETVSTVTNVYLAGNADGGISVSCYTDAGSSATLAWQNLFKPSTGNIVPVSNNLTQNNSNVYITGNGTSFIYILSSYVFVTYKDPFILKLPTSGAYTSSTFTINSKNFTYTQSAYTNTDITSVTATSVSASFSYFTGGNQSLYGSLGASNATTTITTNTTF
jgi:hypothetical protein